MKLILAWTTLLTIISLVRASFTADELDAKIAYLRAGDYGLVRPGPSDATWERQTSGGCKDLSAVLELLAKDSNNTKAAEYLVLCTSNQPTHRQQITTEALDSIISMLDHKDTAAIAGETIWIASFNNKQNHQHLLQAIPKLAKLLTDEDCDCYHAQMWAAAALQNLMASYCVTETGHCWWHWNQEGEFTVEQESPLAIDGEPARQKVLNTLEIVDALSKFVCQGPSPGDLMPGEATINHTVAANMVTWAAVGALKNFALNPEARALLLDDEDLLLCICELAGSDDWLERAKAEDVLFHLRLDESCHVGEYSCIDHHDWISLDGEHTCRDYEPHILDTEDEDYYGHVSDKMCHQYGDVVGHNTFTAKEACCYCGGGIKHDHVDVDEEHEYEEHNYYDEEENSDSQEEL